MVASKEYLWEKYFLGLPKSDISDRLRFEKNRVQKEAAFQKLVSLRKRVDYLIKSINKKNFEKERK